MSFNSIVDRLDRPLHLIGHWDWDWVAFNSIVDRLIAYVLTLLMIRFSFNSIVDRLALTNTGRFKILTFQFYSRSTVKVSKDPRLKEYYVLSIL